MELIYSAQDGSYYASRLARFPCFYHRLTQAGPRFLFLCGGECLFAGAPLLHFGLWYFLAASFWSLVFCLLLHFGLCGIFFAALVWSLVFPLLLVCVSVYEDRSSVQ